MNKPQGVTAPQNGQDSNIVPFPAQDNPFPVYVLPPVLREFVESIAITHKAQDKMGVIALPIIGVLGASLGQGVAAQGRDFLSYPNVYVYCNMSSGGFKSVALYYAEEPVRRYQADMLKDHIENVRPELLAQKKATEKAIESADDEDELKRLYGELAEIEEGLEFCPVKVEDVTIESVMETGIRSGQVFISTDEASIVDGLVSGRYSKGFSNEGPLCKMWSAKDLSRKRKNEGLMYNDRVVCSMVLLGQEHITKKMLENEHMVSSGFPARFLFDSVEVVMQKRDKDRQPVPKSLKAKYNTLIVSALSNFWNRPSSDTKVVPITEDGMDALDEFHNSYCDDGNGKLSDLRRNLLRSAEQATRVALILHGRTGAER